MITMSTLQFMKTHNMVAFLHNPHESEGFEQIVDFLVAYPIRYALTRIGKVFSGKETPLTPTMVGPSQIDMGEGSRHPTNAQHTPYFDIPPPQPKKKTQTPRKAKKKIIEVPQPRVNTHGSDEGTIKLNELMETCTKLSKRVLDLEAELHETKTSQQIKIDSLEMRVNKLEKKNRSRTHKLKRLYKISLTARVETSSDEEPAMDEEDASKHGKSIEEININDEITLVSNDVQVDDVQAEVTKVTKNDDAMDVNDGLEVVEGVMEVVSTAKLIAEIVSTAGVKLNAASVQIAPVSAATNIDSAATIKTTTKIVTQAPKAKGIVFHDQEESTTRKHSSQSQPKRKIMSTYLKNMEGCRINELKHLDFDALKENFDKAFKRVNTFANMYTEVVDADKVRAPGKSVRVEKMQEEQAKTQKVDDGAKLNNLIAVIPKQVGIDVVPLAIKTTLIGWKGNPQIMKKLMDDMLPLEVTPEDGKSLAKIYKERKKNFFQIFRADGNSQMYVTFSKMIKNFDREDLEVLWRIDKERFEKTQPLDYMDNFLLHTLKTMFEHHVEDNVWKHRQGLARVKN
nr:hypothetical protein [Tanacetum cinerariifolium]